MGHPARIGTQCEGILRAHRMAAGFIPRDSVRFSIVAAELAGCEGEIDGDGESPVTFLLRKSPPSRTERGKGGAPGDVRMGAPGRCVLAGTKSLKRFQFDEKLR